MTNPQISPAGVRQAALVQLSFWAPKTLSRHSFDREAAREVVRAWAPALITGHYPR